MKEEREQRSVAKRLDCLTRFSDEVRIYGNLGEDCAHPKGESVSNSRSFTCWLPAIASPIGTVTIEPLAKALQSIKGNKRNTYICIDDKCDARTGLLCTNLPTKHRFGTIKYEYVLDFEPPLIHTII